MLTFTGSAGTLPTGAATLNPRGHQPADPGMALDGNEVLLPPSQTYAYVQWRGLGIHADNSGGSAMILQGECGHVSVYVPGASGATVLPTPAAFTKV